MATVVGKQMDTAKPKMQCNSGHSYGDLKWCLCLLGSGIVYVIRSLTDSRPQFLARVRLSFSLDNATELERSVDDYCDEGEMATTWLRGHVCTAADEMRQLKRY